MLFYPDVAPIIHEIIALRSLPVRVIVPLTIACVTCSGFDPLCAVCAGRKKQTVAYTATLSGIVNWKDMDQQDAESYGLRYDGDIEFVFPHTFRQYVATSSGYASVLFSGERSIIDSATFFVVDKYVCEPVAIQYEGRPYNRIVVVAKQVMNQGG